MSELRAIVEAARAQRARGEAFVAATVVRVFGSNYRHPGARMLASQERWLAGSISGGCLEREVLTKGFFRTREQPCVLVRHDEALDERAGSGCQGVIDVLLERIGPAGACDVFQLAERCLRDECRAALASVVRSSVPEVPVGARLTYCAGAIECSFDAPGVAAQLGAAVRGALERQERRAAVVDCGAVEALVETLAPPPHLFVFGGGHDAGEVVALAKRLGWSVTVWDGQTRISVRERLRAADRYLGGPLDEAAALIDRCAQPAAVIMGHHYDHDRAALQAVLGTRARYLGVLGPRQRTERMLSDCAAAGLAIDDALRARIHGPAGLRLGAETPIEIALAIVAEAQAVLAGGEPQLPSPQPDGG